jgi:chromosome partitioning protein
MPPLTPESLRDLTLAAGPERAGLPRQISIWEITTWILPMAPEHLRRVLAADPALPQGTAGVEGGTRWFTPSDVATLRQYFAARSRKFRIPPTPRAPLVALTGPRGGLGRSTALLHLACAAALSGHRVLVIDGDPSGTIADRFRGETSPHAGPLSLVARSAARHLRALNEARLDRGEPPVIMDDTLSAALPLTASDLIRPSAWPGLDVMAAPNLIQADLQIGAWRMALRGWRPWRALAQALDQDGLRSRYDLILCDTPRGLGPLALSILASADVLLAPLPLGDGGVAAMMAGLQDLGQAVTTLQDDEQTLARALGQTAIPYDWQSLLILPTRAGEDAARRLAGFAAKPALRLLTAALPEIPQVASGTAAHFYDLDYRDMGRLTYAPLRAACDAAWHAVAEAVKPDQAAP